MFGDRRKVIERRQQHLPIPKSLDRRLEGRRCRGFEEQQDWWLRIQYAVELVSEEANIFDTDNDDSSNKPSPKPPASKR